MALTDKEREKLLSEIAGKSDSEMTTKDYTKQAQATNWATAQPGSYYNTGNGTMKEYGGVGAILGDGGYLGSDVMAAVSDANRYNYDIQLDPRSNNGAGNAINDLLMQVNLKANQDAINGNGTYEDNLAKLYQQIGYTDVNGIYDSLQKNKSTGLKTLSGETLESAYSLGNPNWTYDPAYDIGSEAWRARLDQQDALRAAAEAERAAYLATLPENRGAGVYEGDVRMFSDGTTPNGGAQTRRDALGQLGVEAGAFGHSPTQMLQSANAAQGQGFQYDINSDPVWLALQEQYRRLGAQAMTDSQAQLAARTGGMASSYAGQVGQQTYDEYMRGLTDYVPTLYDAAYARWQDQQDRLAAAEDRKLAEEQALLDAIYGSSGRGSSSGSSSSTSAKPTLTAAQTLEALKNGVVNEQTLAAYRYYYGQDWDGEAASLGVKASSGGGSGYGSGSGNGDWSEVDAWVAAYGDGALDDYLNSNYKSLGYKSKSAALSAYNNYRLSAGLYTPKSKNYDSIYKTASGYKDAGQRQKYIESAVNGGMLTPEEAYEIFMLLGGDVTDTASSGTGKKPVAMSYQTVRNALAKSGSSKELWTESQWNALKQRTGTGAKTYKDYLQNMYDLYG